MVAARFINLRIVQLSVCLACLMGFSPLPNTAAIVLAASYSARLFNASYLFALLPSQQHCVERTSYLGGKWYELTADKQIFVTSFQNIIQT